MTDKTDIQIAELVARFEQAVIDHGNLYDAYYAANKVPKTNLGALFTAMVDAAAVRTRCRLELLQFLSQKEEAA